MTPANEVLQQADHVLLDFDGPVCAVFSTITNAEVTNALRACLTEHGHTPTDELRHATDPFDVLAYALGISTGLAAAVEAEFTRWEQHAVQYAAETPGIREALAWITGSGRSVTIISNNATAAINTYLANSGLERYVSHISARQPNNAGLLKPDPYLLRQALETLRTTGDRCVMIGDSTTDIQAATTVRVPTIAYANKPEKREALIQHTPNAITQRMIDVLPHQ